MESENLKIKLRVQNAANQKSPFNFDVISENIS